MLTEQGRITGVSGAYAWVETQRRAACDNCSTQHGCGSGTLAKVLGRKVVRVRALNDAGAVVGDEVVVGLEDEALLRGSVAAYVVPIFLMICGAVCGDLFLAPIVFAESDLASVVSGLAGLALGIYWLRVYSAKIGADTRYQPRVLSIGRVTDDDVVSTVPRTVEWSRPSNRKKELDGLL